MKSLVLAIESSLHQTRGIDMSDIKVSPRPDVKSVYSFIFDKPFDEPPKIHHQLFAILAMIESGFTENEIIEKLEGRIHRITIRVILHESAENHYVTSKNIGNDRKWRLQFLGSHLLAAYVTVMNRGVRKKG